MERKSTDEKYKAVLDVVYCCILALDEQGELVYYNEAAAELFSEMGIELELVLHTKFKEFTDILRQEADLSQEKGQCHMKFRDFDVRCNFHPWMVSGEHRGMVLLVYGNTHPHCIEQELGKTIGLLEEMSSFVESSPDGFMVTDKNGIIIKVNASFEKELSVKRENIIGRNVEDLVVEDVFPASAALEVIRTKKISTVIISRSGRKLISTGSPVYDEFGEWMSVVVNVRDITELNILQNKLEYQQMVATGYIRELSYFKNQKDSSMVAQSKAMQKIMDMIQALSQVDSTILITGESGTGKEVIVNQIYKTSYRYNKPFMKINCGAIPVTLFESELFGYEDGAFTGARKKGKAGYFEMANGGTLFLDEISELDVNMQVKLLRVLQEGEITRIGGTKTIHVDVRLIAATNKDLEEMVENGQFRQDLYYRLNVVNIEVPPLRERKDDIIPLTQFFLEKYNKKYKKEKMMSMELGKQLVELDWPGNIRELENLIENMVVLSANTVLGVEDMPDKYRRKPIDTSSGKVTVEGIIPLNDAVWQLEKQLLCNARKKYKSTREIAKVLGVNQSTVSRKLGKMKKEEDYNI